MGERSYFEEALHSFTMDVAGLSAVRHLTDLGLSVTEIEKELLFPVPRSEIRKAVWERLLSTRMILLEDPKKVRSPEKATYVKEQGKYGRTSFRRVIVRDEEWVSPEDYEEADFGLYEGEELEKRLLEAGLSESERDYVRSLPWPGQIVYVKREGKLWLFLEKLRKAK